LVEDPERGKFYFEIFNNSEIIDKKLKETISNSVTKFFKEKDNFLIYLLNKVFKDKFEMLINSLLSELKITPVNTNDNAINSENNLKER